MNCKQVQMKKKLEDRCKKMGKEGEEEEEDQRKTSKLIAYLNIKQ